MESRFPTFLQQQQQQGGNRRALAGGGGLSSRDFSPPQSSASRFHHNARLRSSASSLLHDPPPPRLFAPSGAPVPTDFCDINSILAYRQRVNGSVPLHHSGLVSTPSHFGRSHAPVWDHAQRPQASLSGIHAASLRHDALDEAALVRQAFAREFDRHNFVAEARDDTRRNEVTTLSELLGSRRSALLAGNVFCDEDRPSGASVSRSGMYDDSPADVNHRRRTDREDASNDYEYFKTPHSLIERTSPTTASRKRRRENVDNGRERITRQRRVYDPGLAVLPTGGSSPLHLKRAAPEIFGDPYLLRRVLSSSRNRDVEDLQEGQVTSSDRAFAIQGTSPHHAFPLNGKQESQTHSFSPVTKSNQKPSSQHAARGGGLFSGRRPCLPRSEAHPSLPQKIDETDEKIIGAKTSGSPSLPGTNLQVPEPHIRELSARDKASMQSPQFLQSPGNKKQSGGGRSQQLGRLAHPGPSSGQKRSKKRVSRAGGTPFTEHGNSSSRKHQTASGKKRPRPCKPKGKLSKLMETTPRERVTSQVSRLIELSAEVLKGSPESRQGKKEDDRVIVLEHHPAESMTRTGREEKNVHDVRQDEKLQRVDSMIQHNVSDGDHCHDDSDLNKKYPLVHTDSHGEYTLTNVNEVLQARPRKLSVGPAFPFQNPLSTSEHRRESLHDEIASANDSQLLSHNRMPVNILDASFSPSKHHGIGTLSPDIPLGTGWYCTMGTSLPSTIVCPQIQQSSSTVMHHLKGLGASEVAVPFPLHEKFSHPKEQISVDHLPSNSCRDVPAATSDCFMGNELRQTNECSSGILDVQSFQQSSMARPLKARTRTATEEIKNYPHPNALTSHDVTSIIRTLPLASSGEAFKLSAQTVMDGSENVSNRAVVASRDHKVHMAMDKDDRLAGAHDMLGNAAKETSTKMESHQSEEVFPATDDLLNKKTTSGLSVSELLLEHMGTSAGPPTLGGSEVNLSIVCSSKEETPISEAGRLGSGRKPDAPSVHQDRQVNRAQLKHASMVMHQPQGRMVPMPARAGAHTWHRPTDIEGVPNSQPASKSMKMTAAKPISQGSYVRKGNSLVRAPIHYAPVASSRPNATPTGAGKGTGGRVFPFPSRSQRMYLNVRSASKITRNSFRKVFPARQVPSKDPAERAFSSENGPTEPHDWDNIPLQSGKDAAFSHASAKVIRHGTPESQPKALPNEKTAGCNELPQQNVESLRPIIADSKADDMKSCSLEAMTSMASKSKLVYPGLQLSSLALKSSDASSMYYFKSKANQLIASLPHPSSVLGNAESQIGLPHFVSSSQDIRSEKKNNQLVQTSNEAKELNGRLLKSPPAPEVVKGWTNAIWKTTLGKALRQKWASQPPPRVWTLKDESSSQVKGSIPLLFPWKRPGLGIAVRAGRFKALPKAKKGSLLFLMSKKLQRLRRSQPVYTRSVCGFSIHRSGVLSLSGANLKWTKSIEKRSKQASEEATKAVAAVEKKKREEKEAVAEAAKADRQAGCSGKLHSRERIVKVGLVRYKMDASQQTLQRMPDERCCGSDKNLASGQGINSSFLSTPRRLSIGGME